MKFGTDVSITAIGNSPVLDFHQLELHSKTFTFVSYFVKTVVFLLAVLLKEGKGLVETAFWLEAQV